MPTVDDLAGVYVPTWIAPDGTEYDLNPAGTRLFSLNAVAGLGIAPVNLSTTADPLGGVIVDDVVSLPRTVVWPLRVRGTTHLEYLALWRDYARAFALTRRLGPGRLRIARPDGTAREIEAYYQAGFEQEPGEGWVHDTPKISLLCPDGFFRGVDQEEVGGQYETPVDYLSPYPSVSGGAVLGSTTVINTGDVEAWPTWTITGPASAITATNLTLDQGFTLTYALPADQTITITTRPSRILGPGGINITNALTWPGSRLWRLVPGENAVNFDVAGAGPGSSVLLSYYPRYDTP